MTSLRDMIDKKRFNPLIGKSIVLKRKASSATYMKGLLTFYEKGNNVFQCYTIERPWKDNKPYVSCIPPAPGDIEYYIAEVLKDSPSFNYPHLWIKDVPGRTWIKVHVANRPSELHGCIAPGLDLGRGSVGRSRDAMNELMSFFEVGERFPFRIEYL